MTKKFLDSAGLAVVWEKVKEQDATNLQSAKSYTDSELLNKADKDHTHEIDDVTGLQDALDAKSDEGHKHVSADITDLQDKLDEKSDIGHTHTHTDITDWDTELGKKADKVHTHTIADLTDLNDGWDALLKAAPDVASDTDLKALEARVDTAEGDITVIKDGKADKTEAIKDVTASAKADASKVTVTLTKTPISGGAKTSTVDVPAAQADLAGVITENKVKALAGEVAGSVYRVKGTLANIEAVLAVDSATVGDVYNVTAAFTLNGQKFPAGTNVVFVGPGEEGEPDPTQQAQWDALGGTVDLTPYETTAHASSTYATKTELSAVEDKVDANTAAIDKKADKTTVEGINGRLTTAEGEINSLKTSKADKEHGHVIADITDLQDKLDAKTDKSTFDEHIADRTKMHLPAVTAADNGKVLGVVDGNAGWATMSIPLANGTTTAGIVKAADDSVIISTGTIKVNLEAMVLSTEEIEGICK